MLLTLNQFCSRQTTHLCGLGFGLWTHSRDCSGCKRLQLRALSRYNTVYSLQVSENISKFTLRDTVKPVFSRALYFANFASLASSRK